MARLQLRRVCRNCLLFILGLLAYLVFLAHEDPVETRDGLLIDDFLVPRSNIEEQDGEGDGEGGKPVTVAAIEEERRQKAYKEYGFNQYVSDKISLDRSLPDTRPNECKSQMYPTKLPKASVVIIFHNEGWSTLMRTVHSVLNRSPSAMLKEIVLVDDYSNKDHLKAKLEQYITSLRGSVRIIRAKERLGLIRARMLGASNVLGDVVIVLDSHCEVNRGWLPPLLQPIARDPHVVTCPIIDFIDHDTFEYKPMGSFMRGTFNWRFDYKERALTAEQMRRRKDSTEEVWSPVMAGGLFAISKTFFDQLGQYDPGMEVWGGEQYELSFKIWMCGGRMANIPCSRVGHVYRRNVPYTYPKANAVLINFRRVAEVWMDDYKEWLYERRPEIKRVDDYGDISERVALRRRLKCKSFKWYMQNVANDTVRQNYEPLRASGQVRNPSTNLCLDRAGVQPGEKMTISTCRPYSASQKFQYSFLHEFRNIEDCIDFSKSGGGSELQLYRCHEMQGNQEFHYTQAKTIRHTYSDLCVTVEPGKTNPVMRKCSGTPAQVWEIVGK